MRKALAILAGILLAGGASVKTADAMIASEEYNWYGTVAVPSSDASDGGVPTCGSGTKTLCARTVTKKCTEWHSTSAGLGVSSMGGNFDFGITCATWVEKETLLYYP